MRYTTYTYIELVLCLLLLTIITGSSYAQVANPQPYAGGTKINFVRSWDAKAPDQNPTNLKTRAVADVMQTTQYLDGLGRPIQNVVKQITPLAKDLVTPMVYDVYGREKYKYLAFASNVFLPPDVTNDGNFKMSPFQQDSVFNKNQFPGETYYYSQVNYEASPFDRALTTYAAGNSWVAGNRGVTVQYLNNATSDSVQIWTVADANASIPASAGTYAAGVLTKTITTDEGSRQTVEYKDKLGKVILKKTKLWSTPAAGHSGWLCTYYIYDDFENLRCVLQPRAIQLLQQAGNWSITTAIRDELCFYYSYDDRKRMIIKKVPGAGEVWIVYDARDRLVMSQDSLLRIQGKWMVIEYDSQNRPWRTGLLTNASNRSTHQAAAANSTTYPNTSSGYEVLTQTYYDNYSWVSGTGTTLTSTIDATYTGNSTYFITTYNTSPTYAQQLTATAQTRGLVTGTKSKVIGTASQYVYTVSFYDEDGRVIQVQSINYTGGKDIMTTQYNFSGNVLRILQQHSKTAPNAQTHLVLTKLNYDAGGRLLTIYKNIDNAGSDQLIATNTFNELGQLQNKAEGNALENMAYAYNIRGWTTSINKNYLSTGSGNYFGMELAYDKTTAAVTSTSYTAAQYNGNITGTIWKSKGDGVNRKYDFTYDNVNRLTAANFNQNASGTTWSASVIDYTVSNLTYDYNGNILTMNQKGFKLNNSPLIDQLSYTYQNNSNKLAKVSDAIPPPAGGAGGGLGDFKDGANGSTDDYSYDGNGNMKLDNNKAINSVTCNHLNLPNVVTVTGKGTITYTYDAGGNKLKKTTVEGPKTTTTLYLGSFVYQNDTLQFVSHEEGRARWAFHKFLNGTTGYKFEYDYFLKDHLGNVRMVLTQQKDTAQYMATMEAAYRNTEKQLFYNLPASNYSRAAVPAYPSDPTTNPNDSIMRLNGSGQKVGAAIVLKVMSGDVVDVAVKAYYTTQTYTAPNNSLTDALLALANGIVSVSNGTKGTVADFTSPSGLAYGALQSFMTNNNPTITSKPRAYLNWVLLDEQFNYVANPASGALAVGNYPASTLNTLGQTGISVTKNGYLYIFVNNETPGWNVFFDNLSVKHYTGPLLEETHYYPFGLIQANISSRALKSNYSENKRKYNGIEFDNDLDISSYEAFYRELDPQTGRWWQIDPKVDAGYESVSPYASMYNDPIKYSDPLGDEGCCKFLDDIGEWASDKIENFKNNTLNQLDWAKNRVNEAVDQMGENFDNRWAARVDPLHQLMDNPMSAVTGVGPGGLLRTVFPMEVNAGKAAASTEVKVVTPSVQNVTKGQTLKQQAEGIANANGKSRITLRSEKIQMEIDLKGSDHFDKKTMKSIPTPHTKISPRNFKAPRSEQPAYNSSEKKSLIRPATKEDIRAVRKFIESQKKIIENQKKST